MSNRKKGRNKLWPEANDGEPNETGNVSVDEIVQLCNNIPVSYTHLDVYKRQVYSEFMYCTAWKIKTARKTSSDVAEMS